MSSMKIKLIGLLILMGCVTVEASTFYTYKKPDGATIITTREVKEPGYELLNITIHQANGPILETRGLSNNSVSTSNVSKPTSTNSVSKSNVSKFYKPAALREEVKKSFEYLKPNEQVEVLEVFTSSVDSYNSFIEKGYALIGESIFSDWSLPKNSLVAQAKKVGATVVTFSKSSESTVSYTKSDDPNNLDFIYNYHVVFYVKTNYFKNPNALGIIIGQIPLEARKTYQRNTGVYVANVVQGTKAYNVNILNDDVIIAINDNPILTADDFDNIKAKELKKTKVLDFKILRQVNNELKELNIPINFE